MSPHALVFTLAFAIALLGGLAFPRRMLLISVVSSAGLLTALSIYVGGASVLGLLLAGTLSLLGTAVGIGGAKAILWVRAKL